MNFACPVARVGGYGRDDALRPDRTQRSRGGGRRGLARGEKARKRAMRRLLEAVLKVLGIALLLVACTMFVYLGAVLLARGADWILIP